MATPNKLAGVTPHDLARVANQGGGLKAAGDHFGVTAASISPVLKGAGFTRVTVWIAPGEKVVIQGHDDQIPLPLD